MTNRLEKLREEAVLGNIRTDVSLFYDLYPEMWEATRARIMKEIENE